MRFKPKICLRKGSTAEMCEVKVLDLAWKWVNKMRVKT